MRIKQFLLGVLILLGVSGCIYANPIDTSINGTWHDNDRDSGYKFNNGIFEFYIDDFITWKGTYTASSGRIKLTYTHFHGAMYGLENRFYTIRELQSAPLRTWERGELRIMIENGGASYSVIGNRLTIRYDFEDMGIAYLIRRN